MPSIVFLSLVYSECRPLSAFREYAFSGVTVLAGFVSLIDQLVPLPGKILLILFLHFFHRVTVGMMKDPASHIDHIVPLLL